jgi:hypothetical protein
VPGVHGEHEDDPGRSRPGALAERGELAGCERAT